MARSGSLCACVIALLAMTACSTPPSAPASPHSSAPAAVEPRLVELRPVTISFQGKLIARLYADGRTESAGPNAPGTVLSPGPTIHADGTIALTRDGATARLDGDGNVYVLPSSASPREQLFGRIVGDRFTYAGSTRAADLRVEGDLIVFGEDDSAQIDGDVTPSVRHTVLVMAVAYSIENALSTP